MTITYSSVTSSCFPYECCFILGAVAPRSTNSCSAVTSLATRWTELPPQQRVARSAKQAAQAGGIACAKAAHRT